MHKFSTDIDARSLLDTLAKSGHLDAASSQRAENLIAEQAQQKELPLHLHILSGIGAFFASICFIGFLVVSEIVSIRHETGFLAWGAVFICCAIGLYYAIRGDRGTALHSFLLQSSLSAMGAGKILFVLGMATQFKTNEGWGATLGILIVTTATYFVYPLSLDRFLSLLALLISVCLNLLAHRSMNLVEVLAMNALFVAQLGISGLFLIDSKFRRKHIVIPYAAAFALCYTVLHLLSTHANLWRGWAVFDVTFINYALTAALIVLIGWTAGDQQKLKTEPVMIAMAGTLLLGVLSTPGILLALCLMVVGYAKHELILTILGILLMPLTIFHYYYSLELTLLMKSGILVGSGAVLLAGYAYMAVRKINGQVRP